MVSQLSFTMQKAMVQRTIWPWQRRLSTRIVTQKYLQRQLIHYAGDIETQAYDEGVDVDELMQHAEGELFQLSQGNMKQDYTQIDPVIKEAVDILQRAAQNKGGLTGIPTGYQQMDDMTSGWQPSDLVIIA